MLLIHKSKEFFFYTKLGANTLIELETCIFPHFVVNLKVCASVIIHMFVDHRNFLHLNLSLPWFMAKIITGIYTVLVVFVT